MPKHSVDMAYIPRKICIHFSHSGTVPYTFRLSKHKRPEGKGRDILSILPGRKTTRKCSRDCAELQTVMLVPCRYGCILHRREDLVERPVRAGTCHEPPCAEPLEAPLCMVSTRSGECKPRGVGSGRNERGMGLGVAHSSARFDVHQLAAGNLNILRGT